MNKLQNVIIRLIFLNMRIQNNVFVTNLISQRKFDLYSLPWSSHTITHFEGFMGKTHPLPKGEKPH